MPILFHFRVVREISNGFPFRKCDYHYWGKAIFSEIPTLGVKAEWPTASPKENLRPFYSLYPF